MYPVYVDILKALFVIFVFALVGFGLSACDPESLLEVVS